MIQKTFAKFGTHSQIDSNLVVAIESIEQLTEVINFYKEKRFRIRGISLNLSFLEQIEKETIKNSNLNFFHVIVDKNEIPKLTLSKTKKHNSFTETIIPVENFSKELIAQLSNTNRVIVDYNQDNQRLEEISSELLANKFFPHTKNLPFCKTNIDQAIELFTQQGTDKCPTCKLNKYCMGSSNPEPITNPDKDLIAFLESKSNGDRF